MTDYITKVGGRGILTDKDLPRLDNARGRVFRLMMDGAWHTAVEIREAARGSEGLRRLRELRDVVDVEKRLISRGLYEYRVAAKS